MDYVNYPPIPNEEKIEVYLNVLLKENPTVFRDRLALVKSEIERMKTVNTIEAGILRCNAYKYYLKHELNNLELDQRNNPFIDAPALLSTEEGLSPLRLPANQKVILINELGILDHLRKKKGLNTSVNRIAAILALLIDEKTTTLQSYLNALLNTTNAEDKNPYSSKSAVEKIKNLLIKHGIDPK